MSGEISPTGKSSGPGSSPGLRASHTDRDRVVDVLRIAAGDGLLTADELDERLEAAFAARTLSELATLTADLPRVAATAGATGAEVKDLVRIEQVHSGAIERVGRWVVPRRLELVVTLPLPNTSSTQVGSGLGVGRGRSSRRYGVAPVGAA